VEVRVQRFEPQTYYRANTESKCDILIGSWNAPRRQRIMGGLLHVRNRAPFLGGSFAMWGGVFSSIDCLMIYYRQKDDPLNEIISGFVTGGVLAIRGGLSVAFKNALIGGLILTLI
jgi:import inner membrane translocase subunit TIM17